MAAKEIAYLRVLTGPHQGRVYVLKGLSVFDVGKGNGCQVRIEDGACATNHCRVYRKGESWTFFDLNTEQGSWVNDIPVSKRELAGGEIIRFGDSELQFTFEPPKKKTRTDIKAPADEAAPAPAHSETPVPAPSLPAGETFAHVPPQGVGLKNEAFARPARVEPAAAPPPGSVPSGPPPVEFTLTVIDGDKQDVGKKIEMAGSGSAVIGRGVESDMQLMDGKVSRRHTRFEWGREGVWVIDLDSANGTVVDGEPVRRKPLESGAYVRLGFTVLSFERTRVIA